MATVSDENDPVIGDDMSAPAVAAPSAREFGPDVTVVRKEAFARLEQTWFPPEAVELVEVVSPDSVDRDRERKPELYAKAGIPHFWRVEHEGDEAVVHVHAPDPARGEYGKPSIHRKRLEPSVPHPVDIDIDLSDLLNH
ncbi:Uma2 family endonuclease [Nocardiopsis lambiniae]|uniref:Uma2 family endonuclease n=1 Tax=Nocardiopsis lambiniae TaxID=3075539 RepID=A0ABU2M950_9ACTN|nr:Uma2 family endonuclease [Nocardiopsis sp. DSM 44743]MDT0329139.1 Uma2 family endonuclease [Nocardiopsis sp. DSM 44743]